VSPVIDALGLGYEYPDGTKAIEDVDFTAHTGERIGILGPNGAGKSTLLMLLGGLLQPSAGQVQYFDGIADADEVRDRLAVVLQEPDEYLFNPTIREDLEYGPSQLEIPAGEAERRVSTIAAELSLTRYLDQPPFRLSGGEKRRAALAAGLTPHPEVVLVDEPFSDVDATHTESVIERLDEVVASGGTTVVAISDSDLLPRVADRVYLVDANGRIAGTGTTREILTDAETLEQCGLRPPQVTRLFQEAGHGDPPLTIEEGVERLQSETDSGAST
jgi:cobalt/nickel transport system ATP-binding protein